MKVSRSGAWPYTIESVLDSPGARVNEAAAKADGVRLVVDWGVSRMSLSEAPCGFAWDEKKLRGTLSVVSVPKSICWSQMMGSSSLAPSSPTGASSSIATAK